LMISKDRHPGLKKKVKIPPSRQESRWRVESWR